MGTLKLHERLRIPAGRHLTVGEHTVNLSFPLHWHSYFEMEIVLEGKGHYIINDVPYDMARHNLFLLTPTDLHNLALDGTARFLNLSFDEEMVDERDVARLLHTDTQRAYTLTEEGYHRIVAAAELLGHECEIDGDCRKQLLQYILTAVFRESPKRAEFEVQEETYGGIKRAIVYMELHFRESISLAALADEAGYHPTYFSELFRCVTGKGYREMLTSLRLGHAKALLANGHSVSDACHLSGFGSLSAFGTAFCRHVGMSPTEYKKQTKAR